MQQTLQISERHAQSTALQVFKQAIDAPGTAQDGGPVYHHLWSDDDIHASHQHTFQCNQHWLKMRKCSETQRPAADLQESCHNINNTP